MRDYQPSLINKFYASMSLHNRGVANRLVREILDEMHEIRCNSIISEVTAMSKVLTDWLNNNIERGKVRGLDDYVIRANKDQAERILAFLKPIEVATYAKYWIDDVVRHFIPFAAYIHGLN